MALDKQTLMNLARAGAKARLEAINAEIATIRRAFGGAGGSASAPAGRGVGTRRRGRPRKRGQLSAEGRRAIAEAQRKRWAAMKKGASKPGAKRRGRRRHRMSAAEKKAVSIRMKKYWAERRKAKGKKS